MTPNYDPCWLLIPILDSKFRSLSRKMYLYARLTNSENRAYFGGFLNKLKIIGLLGLRDLLFEKNT